MKLEYYRQILEKYSNVFRENPVQWESSCSMRTDGQPGTTKVIVTFRSFVPQYCTSLRLTLCDFFHVSTDHKQCGKKKKRHVKIDSAASSGDQRRYRKYRVILSLEAPNKFGKSIPEFGETHSSVLGCERRPVSASIMSRSCF